MRGYLDAGLASVDLDELLLVVDRAGEDLVLVQDVYGLEPSRQHVAEAHTGE